ncbi:MAG: glycosyltransferase family 4 protein [Acidobacteriota bacterium]
MKVLLLNQCFWPDVMATAQQLTDLARGLTERGHQVTVITGRRGYDDPELKFQARERRHGIEIIRVRAIAAGKSSRWRRALNFASFLAAAALRLVLIGQQDVVVALTSPPLVSWLASLFTRLKGGRLVFWVMDLNPDEAIAAGWLKPESSTARILSRLLQSSMRHAARIVVLDRFMQQRVLQKGIAPEKIAVISPWAQAIHFDQQGREAFRREHGLMEKFVVMYAGNHSPCHPLDTVLAAGLQLAGKKDIAFCFVGGGSEMRKVKEFAQSHELPNILCLPYQPQEELAAVLSAADMHLVVMGDKFSGIVHPCKVYNVLAIGAPLLYIGPGASPIGDIVRRISNSATAMQAKHGEADLVTRIIGDAAIAFALKRENHLHSQTRAANLVETFSKATLLPMFIHEIETLDARSQPVTEEAAKLQSA